MDLTDRPQDPNHDIATELIESARQAENAIRQLARLTIQAPSLIPADIDHILGHLTESVGALPQVAAQLGRILDRSRDTYELVMDGMTATTDPDLAIDTARLHLDVLRDPAVETYRHLNAARNEAAHISATPHTDDTYDEADLARPAGRRPEDHPTPPSSPEPTRRGPAR